MNWLLSLAPRRPIVTLVVAGVLAVLSVLLILRLRPETSLDAMLNPNEPATVAMTRVMNGFPVTEELLVMASLPAQGPADPARLIAFAERLAKALENDRDLATSVRYRPTDQSRRFVEEVIAPAGLLYLSEAELAEARRRLSPDAMAEQFRRNEAMLAAPGPAAGGLAKAILRDPLRLHELLADRLKQSMPAGAQSTEGYFSSDGRALLIRIEGARPMSDLNFAEAFTNRVTAAAEAQNTDRLDLKITGSYAIAAHNSSRIRTDATWDTASSVVCLAALFVVLYARPVWTFVVAAVPIGIGILCGFGVYALFSDTITPLAAVIGGALGGIGIDYSTHMLAHHQHGASPTRMVQRLAAPLLAACVTSVIGFAVIGWSPVRLLRDFALVGSLSLIGAFLAALTVLPALLALRQTSATARVRLPQVAWRQPRCTLMVATIALLPIGIIAFAGPMPGLDQDTHNLHPQPNPPLQAQTEVAERMGFAGGSIVVHVAAPSAEELVRRAHAVQTRLAGVDVVKSTFGPASLLSDPSTATQRAAAFSEQDVLAALSAFDAAVAGSGFDPRAYAPYRAVLPELLRPDRSPAVDDLRRYPELADTVLATEPAVNEGLVHLTLRQSPRTREETAQVVETLQDALKGIDGATLTGMSVISQQTLATVRRDLPRVALLAFGGVAIYLAAHYRSLRLAALAMVPTFVSLLLLLAVMRVASIELNMVNLVMVPLLLGINIDFGIFAADALRGDEGDSLHDHFRSSLAAMLVCASTAVIGFGSLAMTSVPAVRSLGWLVNVGIAGCTLGAVFILWPIVILLARKRGTP